ncbi:hypothetical protein CCACVL1_04694 [Corchorus capsularis]|uniref:Zinc finger, CCHC-type n=1 Tax=Corchorus capsularis TaxID=210143 RepID=A0A1R3JQF5_COCAP|nr:hypothetical protein CCACVL1_04694 [Corchorus capsularis]
MATNTSNTFSLRSVLEKDKLDGLNFLDWYRNLRIVLKQERKLYVLEEPLSEEPLASAPRAERDAYKKHQDDALDVACLMLATMTPDLQKHHEEMDAFDMIKHLKQLYQGQARQERIDVSKPCLDAKWLRGILWERIQFIMNYNMNEIDKPLPKLLSMLRTAEANMKKAKPNTILMVKKGKKKAEGKFKPKVNDNKVAGKSKQIVAALKPKGGVIKEGSCFHCCETGHWKRNCKVYLEELKKKRKGSETSTSGIYVIEVNLSTSTSWVLDTRCGSHVCVIVQGLKRSRKLAKGDVDLRVGNGARVAALTCGIVSQLIAPATPQWNGVAKRRNRTLLDMVRSMMSHANLPVSFWGHALETAAFTLNRVPSRSVRTHHLPARYALYITHNGDVSLMDQDEPTTYQEAVAGPESEKWLEAMKSEMDSMYANQVWTLVDPPKGIKPIGCKWLFKKKTDMDGNVHTYKGRFVAKGFRQIHGVDYDETFSPVAMLKSIRILLAIAAFYDYEIWQMDVKTALMGIFMRMCT